MDFRYYIALCLILVAPSCCSTREERAAQRAWEEVTVAEGNDNEYKYLALVKYGAKTTEICSASIPTAWTVMTYCTGNPTKAYAGMLKVDVSDNTTGAVQERDVMSVADYSEPLNALKICKVAKWILNKHVGTINLNLNGKRGRSKKDCKVLGFGKKQAGDAPGTEVAHVMTGEIGDHQTCGLNAGEDGVWYSEVKADEKLDSLDLGGPVVCSGMQEGINMKFVANAYRMYRNGAKDCNLYIKIAKYSKWIGDQIKAAESGESGGINGTDSNNTTTTPSSAHSIHSSLNKYSQWKVLLLLCLMAVKFLAY